MKFCLLTLTLTSIFFLAHVAGAYVPEKKLMDIQAVMQRASKASTIKKPIVAPNASDSSKHAIKVVATRKAVEHKRWGIDNNSEDEYWHDSRIHTLGNCGFMGAVHAALAPISTKMIDNIAYEGVDIRQRVADELSSNYHKKKAKVLDLCCGVGFSTRALTNAYPDAEKVVGVDTSTEMLSMANFISAHTTHLKPLWDLVFSQGQKLKMGAKRMCSTSFKHGNAESTPFKDGSFDVVTIMYAFHEAPKQGRQRILEEVRRLLSPGGVLAVIDISTDYTPSKQMLAGEPYVIEYQENIHKQLGSQRGFNRAQYKTLVPGHVDMWVLQRSTI